MPVPWWRPMLNSCFTRLHSRKGKCGLCRARGAAWSPLAQGESSLRFRAWRRSNFALAASVPTEPEPHLWTGFVGLSLMPACWTSLLASESFRIPRTPEERGALSFNATPQNKSYELCMDKASFGRRRISITPKLGKQHIPIPSRSIATHVPSSAGALEDLPAYPPFLSWCRSAHRFWWLSSSLADCTRLSRPVPHLVRTDQGQARIAGCRASHVPPKNAPARRGNGCSGPVPRRGEKRPGRQRFVKDNARAFFPNIDLPVLPAESFAVPSPSAGQRVLSPCGGNRPSPPRRNTDASADISNPV